MMRRRGGASGDASDAEVGAGGVVSAARLRDWPRAAELVEGIGSEEATLRSTLELLDSLERVEVARAMKRPTRLFFTCLLPTEQAMLLEELPIDQALDLVMGLEIATRRDMYSVLPASTLLKLLSFMPSKSDEHRAEIGVIKGLLRFPPGSAGFIMSTLRDSHVVLISDTVESAVQEVLRRPEAWPIVLVVDELFSLRGVVHAVDLLKWSRESDARPSSIAALLETSGRTCPRLRVDATQLEAARLLRKSTWPFVPVVDASRRGLGDDTLCGVVSAATALEVLALDKVVSLHRASSLTSIDQPQPRPRASSIIGDSETNEALAKATTVASQKADDKQSDDSDAGDGAVDAGGNLSYAGATVASLVRRRLPWLFVLVLLNIASTMLLGQNEEQLARHIALAAFIPLVVGMGGNTGTQSSALIVAALATRDTRPRDLTRALKKEVAVGLLLSVSLAALTFVIAALQARSVEIGLVVSTAMAVIVMTANLLGVALPFTIIALGGDPSVASSPVLTSLIDVIGITTYLASANLILG